MSPPPLHCVQGYRCTCRFAFGTDFSIVVPVASLSVQTFLSLYLSLCFRYRLFYCCTCRFAFGTDFSIVVSVASLSVQTFLSLYLSLRFRYRFFYRCTCRFAFGTDFFYRCTCRFAFGTDFKITALGGYFKVVAPHKLG